MTPMTRALVTVAELLDAIGDAAHFVHTQVYENGEAKVQVWLDGINDIRVLDALASEWDVEIRRGEIHVPDDGGIPDRPVYADIVRDGVTITFWTREQVPS